MLARALILGFTVLLSGCLDQESSQQRDEPPAEMRGGIALKQARCCGHSLSLLPNGQILVAGGFARVGDEENPAATASAELINPATNQILSIPAMSQHRRLHTATVLKDGRVLIAGGTPWDTSVSALATAEIYDPSTQQFHYTHQLMARARYNHTATLLADGKVLLTGGDGLYLDQVYATVEIFDPADESFTEIYGHMVHARTTHSATLLKSGQVLIVGGINWGFGGAGLSPWSAEIYDPAKQSFQSITEALPVPLVGHQQALLPSGKVLLAVQDKVLLFNEDNRTFTQQVVPLRPRDYAPMVQLPDGGAAIVSGTKWPDGFDSLHPNIDVFTEGSGVFNTRWPAVTERFWSNAIVDNDGYLWVVGGQSNKEIQIAEIEAFYTK